jgi:hypothetical protein
MNRSLLRLSVVLAIVAQLGCVVREENGPPPATGATAGGEADATVEGEAEGEAATEEAPPPPQAETIVIETRPTPRHVWIGGHWAWRARWVWVPGHWYLAPVGRVWVAGHWWRGPKGHWHWTPGHWAAA